MTSLYILDKSSFLGGKMLFYAGLLEDLSVPWRYKEQLNYKSHSEVTQELKSTHINLSSNKWYHCQKPQLQFILRDHLVSTHTVKLVFMCAFLCVCLCLCMYVCYPSLWLCTLYCGLDTLWHVRILDSNTPRWWSPPPQQDQHRKTRNKVGHE